MRFCCPFHYILVASFNFLKIQIGVNSHFKKKFFFHRCRLCCIFLHTKPLMQTKVHMKSLIAIAFAIFALLGCSALAANTVSVELYYESQCPYCREFITGSLNKAYSADGLQQAINLTLVPFGNALESQDSSGAYHYTCEHGVEECVGNLWAGCVIDQVKDASKYFPVLECMEESGDNFETVVPQCVKKFGFDADAIATCATSQHGIAVQHENAVKTGALSPAHHYVPWIVINGQHNEDTQGEAQENLLSVVCGLLSTKPAGCSTKIILSTEA